MNSNWVSALDNLAANGVLDFDAPAFLLGQNPRYIGHPQMEGIPMQNPMYLPKGVKLKDIPTIDTYGKPEDKPLVQTPKWKKVLFGTLVATGIMASVVAILSKMGKLPKNLNFATIKNYGKTAVDYAKKPFTWIASKIKKP